MQPRKLDVADHFLFELRGNVFKFKYPTIEQIKEIDKIESEEKQTEALYDYIESVDDSPNFRTEFMNTMNVKEMMAFAELLKEELGFSKA